MNLPDCCNENLYRGVPPCCLDLPPLPELRVREPDTYCESCDGLTIEGNTLCAICRSAIINSLLAN